MGASPHARLAPNRAGCSTCVRSVFNGLGSHARPLSRESRRARRRNRRRRAPRERSAAGRRTESPLRPAEHPLATRGAQHTETRATPDRRAPHWQGSEPEQQGRRASVEFSKARSRLRPRGGPCCAGPSAPQPTGVWVAARTPAARVGLHQTLANSRETIHTIPRNALARARPAPIEQFQLEPGRARPPRLPKHRATRCRAPRASCCPSTHWRAGGRPRPLWVPAVARASRRARSTDLPRICRRRLPRARALQPCNRRDRHRAPQRRPSQRGLTRAAACLEHQGPPTSKKAARPPGLRGRRARADRTRCTPHPPRMARRWGEGQAAPPRRDLGRSGRGGLRPHHPWKHRPDQRRWTDPLRGLRSPRHGVEPALRPSRSKCRWHTRRKPPRRRAGLSSM